MRRSFGALWRGITACIWSVLLLVFVLFALTSALPAQAQEEPRTISMSVENDGVVQEGTVSISTTNTLNRAADAPFLVYIQIKDEGTTAESTDHTHPDRREIFFPVGTVRAVAPVGITDDDVDEPSETLVLEFDTLPAGLTEGSASEVTITIEDNDPTIVTLARVGTGGIDEGQTAEFTVTLGRALVAGEIVDVPLSIGGTDITTSDWALALKSGATLNTGVTLTGATTATPQLRFSGAEAETATLILTAEADSAPERSETLTVALREDGTDPGQIEWDSLGTNVGGGAEPASSAADTSFDVVVNASGVTISFTDNIATEGSTSETATFTVVLDTRPTALLTLVVTADAGLVLDGPDGNADYETSSVLTFNPTNWDTPQTVTVRATDDSTDRPRRVFDISYLIFQINPLNPNPEYHNLNGDVGSVTVIDDEPTVATLARVGPGGIAEGGMSEFTVTLSRALAAGEVIDVPLSIDGTDITTDDWSLAFKSGAGLNTGVSLSGMSATTATPQLTFSGVGARTATLILTARQDNNNTEGSETITVALGPDGTGTNGFDRAALGTNVGGGADPASSAADNSFDVVVGVPGITFDVTNNIATEGSTTDGAAFTVVLDFPPTSAVTLLLGGSNTSGAVFDGPDDDMIFNVQEGLTFTTSNWNIPQTVRVRVVDNDDDSPSGSRSIGGYRAASPDSAYEGLAGNLPSVTIKDDDPSVVTLARTDRGGDIAEGATVAFTVTLGRELSSAEIIDVPLAVSGTTGVTTDDWALVLDGEAANTGVTLTGATTATPQLTFSGVGARTATLVLTAVSDLAEEEDETITVALGPDGTGANGFDRAALSTNVDGGADPASAAADNIFDVVVSNAAPLPGVTITVTDDTVTEGDTSDEATFTVVLNTEPSTTNVGIGFIPPPGSEIIAQGLRDFTQATAALIFSQSNWNRPQTIRLRAREDSTDSPLGRELQIEWGIDDTAGFGEYGGLGGTTPPMTVIDNDPTIVSLSRAESGGIAEGETTEFTVTLSRALVEGEVLDVPLSIGGTDVTTSDWALALKAGETLNTGVTLTGARTATPQLRFVGAASQTATLVLTAARDLAAEGDETLRVTFGPNGTGANGFDRTALRTNVGGGADPDGTDNRFDVVVSNAAVVAGVTITVVDATVTEGSTTDVAGFTVRLNTQPSSDVTVTVLGQVSGLTFDGPDGGTSHGPQESLTFTTSNWDDEQTVTVRATEDDTDTVSGRERLSVYTQSSSDNNYNDDVIYPAARVTVTDNDATMVTLAGADGDVSEGRMKEFTLSLGRGLVDGEILPVPLSFGGTTMREMDYTVACPSPLPTGVSCNNLNTATPPTVTFTGPAVGETATSVTLTLTAIEDDTEESGGETVMIGLGTLDGTSGTGLDGGASGTDSLADFRIRDLPVYTISSVSANIIEDSSVLAARTGQCTFTRSSGTEAAAALNFRVTETGDLLTAASKGDFSVAPTGADSRVVHMLPSVSDTTDEPWSTVTCRLLPGPDYVVGSPFVRQPIGEDNDPTIVSLSRTGSGGIDEGETATFTVTLSRALVGSEIIPVPLAVRGTNVDTDDWALALDGEAANTGVTLTGEDTATPQLRFSGAGARTATLILTAETDRISEGDETITVALGPDGSGANGFDAAALAILRSDADVDEVDPSSTENSFDVVVSNVAVPAGVTIDVTDGTATEGSTSETATFTVVLDREPPVDLTVVLNLPLMSGLELDGPDSATDFTNAETITFTTSDWNRPREVTVRATEDNVDSPSGRELQVVWAVPDISSYGDYSGLNGTATVTVTDNDTTSVTLAGSADDVNEGGTKEVTLTLGRGLVNGETLGVPLSFGGTATLGTDYTVACPDTPPTGVTCNSRVRERRALL